MINLETRQIITDNGSYDIPFSVGLFFDNRKLFEEISLPDVKTLFLKIFELPELLIQVLKEKVSLYDSSSSVNAFKFNGKEYWLDKSQRNSLFNLFNSADPEEEFEIVFGEVVIKEKAKVLVEFLKALELYAYRCFVVTQKHLNELDAIKTPANPEEYEDYINTLLNYDYTKGYPEKLEL